MKQVTIHKALLCFIIIALPLSLFYGSNILQLRAEEPRRAIVSIEMYLSGNYIVPTIHGFAYYNKPPLFNWVMVTCFYLFGLFSEWVVRFPSLLAFLCTGIFHFLFARRYIDTRAALLASLFFLTSADIYFYGTLTAGEIDLFYTLLVYLQVGCIFIFAEQRKWLLLFVSSYFFCALGVITKGPPSIAFQVITLGVWLAYSKQFRQLFNWRHFAGLLVFILITGGYFYAYSLQGNVTGFMIRLVKEASQRTAAESDWGPLVLQTLTFPLALLKLMAPWSILVIFCFRKDFWALLKANRYIFFCFLFVCANIPLYWISSQLKNRYIYMFFPFIITILVYCYYQAKEGFGWQEKYFGWLWIAVMVLAVVLAPVLVWLPQLTIIPWLLPKAVFMSLAAAGLLFVYVRFPAERMLTSVSFLILLRFGVSLFYLPAADALDKNFVYRKVGNDIQQITGGQQVFYAQNLWTFDTGIKLGKREFFATTLTTPALITYQVPYYISRANGMVMQFETQITPGKFYITPKWFSDGKNVNVYYRFRDHWTQTDMALVKMK